MRSPGSAFTRGPDKGSAIWLDDELYCNAVEPLLRLAARDINTCSFADLSGETGKPQVPPVRLCAAEQSLSVAGQGAI